MNDKDKSRKVKIWERLKRIWLWVFIVDVVVLLLLLAWQFVGYLVTKPASWSEVANSVCLLNAGTTPIGTGFFVSYPFKGEGQPERTIFLITAKHVAEACMKAAGSNTVSISPYQTARNEGVVEQMNMQGVRWLFPTSAVDIAAINMTQPWDSLKERIPQARFIDLKTKPSQQLYSKDSLRGVTVVEMKDFGSRGIGLGEPYWNFGFTPEILGASMVNQFMPIVLRTGIIAHIGGMGGPFGARLGLEGTMRPGMSGGPVFIKVREGLKDYPALVGLNTSTLGGFQRILGGPQQNAGLTVIGGSGLGSATPMDEWMNLCRYGQQQIYDFAAAQGRPYVEPPTELERMIGRVGCVIFWLAILAGIVSGVLDLVYRLIHRGEKGGKKRGFSTPLAMLAACSYTLVREIMYLQTNPLYTGYTLSQTVINLVLFAIASLYAVGTVMDLLGIEAEKPKCEKSEAE